MMQEREWTRWVDQRPPNERGTYRYRASFDLCGLPVTAEWEAEMSLCGMGYGDNEWWPKYLHHWDGYNRRITNNTLEWSAVQAYDQPGVVWHGVDLLDCPFTGKQPTLDPVGRYIGAPLWHSEAVYIYSPGVPRRRWTDAKAMVAAWNRRASFAGIDNPAAFVEAARVLHRALEGVIDATANYLPPDGISQDECINRVLAASDNSEVFHALTAFRATLGENAA